MDKKLKHYKKTGLAFLENGPYLCPTCGKHLYLIQIKDKRYCYCEKCYFKTNEI